MAVPLNGVKADESGEDWFVEVGVLRRVGVRVTFEHLEGITIQEVTTTVPTICDNSALQSRRGINTIKEVYYRRTFQIKYISGSNNVNFVVYIFYIYM